MDMAPDRACGLLRRPMHHRLCVQTLGIFVRTRERRKRANLYLITIGLRAGLGFNASLKMATHSQPKGTPRAGVVRRQAIRRQGTAIASPRLLPPDAAQLGQAGARNADV
jgi:hypothetical protein